MTFLASALQAEREQRWIEALDLCLGAVAETPEDPDVLNLLGRLCARAGDVSQALATQGFALYLNPNHEPASRDLDALLSTDPRDPATAQEKFTQATLLAPEIANHQRSPVSLVPFAGMDRVERLLRDSIALSCSEARVHAALGNVLSRRQQRVAAIVEYAIAVRSDPTFTEAHVALGSLFEAQHNEARAALHWNQAMQRRQLYPAAIYPSTTIRVLVLAVPGAADKNTPLDFFVNPYTTALHTLYLVPGSPIPKPLPEYDVIFTAIEEAEASSEAIALAADFIKRQDRPVVNDPAHIENTRRSVLPQALAGIRGCIVPQTVRLSRDALTDVADNAVDVAGIVFPLLVRPIDTHSGIGLALVSDAAELHAYISKRNESSFNLSPFVDYRSADGYFRKYRVVVVDSVPYPYHLAISERWMVHYNNSDMKLHPWMRDEEAGFLANPRSVLDRWDDVFAAIAAPVGLDYFAVDFTVLQDGSVLVFECGGGMFVHCQDDMELFPYKYRYVPRIFDAFDAMLARYARTPSRSSGSGRGGS